MSCEPSSDDPIVFDLRDLLKDAEALLDFHKKNRNQYCREANNAEIKFECAKKLLEQSNLRGVGKSNSDVRVWKNIARKYRHKCNDRSMIKITGKWISKIKEEMSSYQSPGQPNYIN